MPVRDTKLDLSVLFSQQVLATPDAIAVEDEKTTYTYTELDEKVRDLAERLQHLGVARDTLVGVLLARSADYVISCLAALRAGGAFLVLELAYPPDLLADVLEDAKPVVVVTCTAEVGKIKAEIPLIVLDEPAPKTNGHSIERIEQPVANDLDRLAFVAYSSGTTGRPKGIANPHRAPVLSYDLRFHLSDLQVGDRVACNVFFVWEILRPLLRGATVVAIPDEASYDPVALVELLCSRHITETLMTPTLLAAVLVRHPSIGRRLPELKTLWLNGEVVSGDLARRAIQALPNTRLLNCYSACETHEIACGDIRSMLEEDTLYCPVGPPMDADHTYILNDSDEKVVEGAIGELCIGGPLLARGYLNRPETTAKAFVPDPFDATPGSIMYRSGDQARMLPSGVLEITGRVGSMIKLRGYSVVPGKVENAITSHLDVRHSAVVAHGDGLERQLVAYIVRDKENTTNKPSISIGESGHSPSARNVLLPYLAQYMIPALWMELDELPTHGVSGKIDLKRLPSPPNPQTQTRNVVTQGKPLGDGDPISLKHIGDIWAATLNVSSNGITSETTFFDLGGHSLSLANLATRLARTLGVRVPIGRLAAPATLSSHLEIVLAIRDGNTAAVQADLPGVLRADSVLEDDIRPTLSNMCAVNKASTILLTGTTGFLGAFLLNDLLQSTDAKIICLVRFSDPSEQDGPAGIARLRRNMLDLGLWHDSIMERVEILPGNLSRKRIGLSQEAFDRLGARVQVIVHAAATVNLVYPYAALRSANVGGTREILRLACLDGATVQYVSTNGVLPPSQVGWPEDAMLGVEDVPEKLLDGYGQTKWVAEQLVHEASRRGLPVRIIRAGTISGHSTTGAANAWDLLSALIVESIQIGHAPRVEGWRAEMTPVDFVSKAIVHLSNETRTKQTVFHVGDPDPVDTKTVFANLAQLGYPTEQLEWDEWVALWTSQRGSAKGGDGAFTVDMLRSGMPSVDFLSGIVVLANAATRPLRLTVERPKVDVVLLETYTRHWFARGWLPRPPALQRSLGGSAQPIRRGPLSGRVAVVTGASSGIGAAVAAALAREGCHVALAARRADALEAVKRRLVVREGRVIARPTDVTDAAQVAALLSAAEAELGPVDMVVSCAGVMYFTMMAAARADEWERTVDVNCKGLLHVLGASVPGMLARGKGHIVAVSSDAGRKVFPGLGVYSASKFFVEAALQALRLETAGQGLRVSSVQPGNVATELLALSTDAEALEKFGQPSGARVLDADDVAAAIVYALKQPEHVAVNEILIEPREEPI